MTRLQLLLLTLGSLCWALTGTAQTAPSKSLSYDAASKTVTFALQAGAPPAASGKGSFNFNGYSNGGATLVVPPSSKIVMNFVNLDGVPHSAMIIPDADPMPAVGGDPAIPRAYTKDVAQGLIQGGTDVMSFTAPATGSFRIFCGVPGHGQSGMWIRFRVNPNAKSPSWVTS
jgi:sulfocyanin